SSYSLPFTVVSNPDLPPILGCKACRLMQLLDFRHENFLQVAAVVPAQEDAYSRRIMTEFADVFASELGTLPGQVHLVLDQGAIAHVDRSRRIPLAIRDQVKAELGNMVRQGILTRVDQPTDWVDNLVVVRRKSGQLRICIDPLHLNKSLKREHFQLPVLEDIL